MESIDVFMETDQDFEPVLLRVAGMSLNRTINFAFSNTQFYFVVLYDSYYYET